MTHHRLYILTPPQTPELTLTGDLAHRISRVLRLPVGGTVELFDGSGRTWSATIVAAQPKAVRLALDAQRSGAPEPPTVLLAALIRPNRFEWLIEKATELGATHIAAVITERTAVRPAEIGAARLERWRRIAVEAAEQCGRLTVPDLLPPTPLAERIALASGALYIAAEPAHGPIAPLAVAATGLGDAPVTVLTGPEGGFTAAEVQAAITTGATPVSLGSLVLRAETAAIAALAVIAQARQS